MPKYLNSKGAVEFFREFVSIVNRYKAPSPALLDINCHIFSQDEMANDSTFCCNNDLFSCYLTGRVWLLV